MTEAIKFLNKYEKNWCNFFNIRNPYFDSWEVLLSNKIPYFDSQCYKLYPKYNYVYDKLWIAKTQKIDCGILNKEILELDIQYPIFIKPRWGHESASSKNCFKINNKNEIQYYLHIPEMMWSEFINGNEQMTDFFVQQGRVMHQITYLYKGNQKGSVADQYKYISPDNEPPKEMTDWIHKYLNGYSGICNIQYRNNTIIEVSLRLARGGGYIYCTKNNELIKSINNLIENNIWNLNTFDSNFTPFYTFKCFCAIPIIYILPQHIVDLIMKSYNCLGFYEYYFESTGKIEKTFFQFCNIDFDKGMKAKTLLENILFYSQIIFYLLFIFILKHFLFNKNLIKKDFIILVLVLLLYSTTIINPISTNINLIKNIFK